MLHPYESKAPGLFLLRPQFLAMTWRLDTEGPKGWDGCENHSGSGFHDDFWHNMFWIFRCLVGSKMGIEWECKWHILANLNFPWRCHWIKIHKRFTKFHLFRKTWKSSDSFLHWPKQISASKQLCSSANLDPIGRFQW